MVTQHVDSLLARGNTADVYRWGTHAVVKLLRPGIPDEWAAREARITELVHAAGLPAPVVLDVTTFDGRAGIVFERIAGISMWEQMLAHPRDVPRLAHLLADLQAEVHATPAPSGMPKLVDRLRHNIDQAALLSAPERGAAHAELDLLPAGDALCHFDVHPNNVLMGAAGPVIIDWFDAAVGSPTADVVRSSVLMRRDAADCHLPCGDPSLIGVLHDRYVARAVALRPVTRDVLLSWEAPLLAARVAERLPGTILRATRQAWRAVRASQTTQLASSLRSAGGEEEGKGTAGGAQLGRAKAK